MPKQPLDLDILSEQLTDGDINYLLKLRTKMFKERMAWKILQEMERQFDVGVDIVFNGEVTEKRRPTPGELFRIRQALDAFNPADINTAFRSDAKTIASELSADPDADIETLRRNAVEDQDIDRPSSSARTGMKPAKPAYRPSRKP